MDLQWKYAQLESKEPFNTYGQTLSKSRVDKAWIGDDVEQKRFLYADEVKLLDEYILKHYHLLFDDLVLRQNGATVYDVIQRYKKVNRIFEADPELTVLSDIFPLLMCGYYVVTMRDRVTKAMDIFDTKKGQQILHRLK